MPTKASCYFSFANLTVLLIGILRDVLSLAFKRATATDTFVADILSSATSAMDVIEVDRTLPTPVGLSTPVLPLAHLSTKKSLGPVPSLFATSIVQSKSVGKTAESWEKQGGCLLFVLYS